MVNFIGICDSSHDLFNMINTKGTNGKTNQRSVRAIVQGWGNHDPCFRCDLQMYLHQPAEVSDILTLAHRSQVWWKICKWVSTTSATDDTISYLLWKVRDEKDGEGVLQLSTYIFQMYSPWIFMPLQFCMLLLEAQYIYFKFFILWQRFVTEEQRCL
jgi:hypothetical protein